jgi:hypothetical protein
LGGARGSRHGERAEPFQDLARQADVHDVVTRAISGHQTEKMQRHYSTAQREEMRAAVGKVISIGNRAAAVATACEEAPLIVPLNSAGQLASDQA